MTGALLAFCLFAAGFIACVLPASTHLLASTTSNDATSPLSRAELTSVADATRDYSFGDHDIEALYRAIYAADAEYSKETQAAGSTLPDDFPEIDENADVNELSLEDMRSQLATGSERFTYPEATISHLDDCYLVAMPAYLLIAICAVALAICFALLCSRHGACAAGAPLYGAGVTVIVLFVIFGTWAAIDFDSLFSLVHALLFSQGNWTFPYNSLLICALPTGFWMGMGAIWLAVTLGLSILAFAYGEHLRKKLR